MSHAPEDIACPKPIRHSVSWALLWLPGCHEMNNLLHMLLPNCSLASGPKQCIQSVVDKSSKPTKQNKPFSPSVDFVRYRPVRTDSTEAKSILNKRGKIQGVYKKFSSSILMHDKKSQIYRKESIKERQMSSLKGTWGLKERKYSLLLSCICK